MYLNGSFRLRLNLHKLTVADVNLFELAACALTNRYDHVLWTVISSQ